MQISKRWVDTDKNTGLTGADIALHQSTDSKLNEIGHMVFLDAYAVTEEDQKRGYIDLRDLGLKWNPISGKDVNLHIVHKTKQLNYERVKHVNIPYDYRIGDKNKTFLYFRDVKGVKGDFKGQKTGCTHLDYAGEIVQIDVQVYKP